MKRPEEMRFSGRHPFAHKVVFETWHLDDAGSCTTIHEGVCLDISAGGGGLLTITPLKKGDVVKLMVPMGTKDLCLPVFTEVVWSEDTGAGIRAGVHFLA